MSTIIGVKWIVMDSDIPHCKEVSVYRNQTVNFLSKWLKKSDSELLIIHLLADFLGINLVAFDTLFEVEIATYNTSYIKQLRKYQPIKTVSYYIIRVFHVHYCLKSLFLIVFTGAFEFFFRLMLVNL